MPMIYHLQWPPEVLTDAFSVVVDIYRLVDQDGYDDRGNPLPPLKQYIVQDEPADIQPKGGTERAVQSATTYEATHTLFLGPVQERIPAGATVDVKDEAGGEVRQSLKVVYVADWGTHAELDLRAV